MFTVGVKELAHLLEVGLDIGKPLFDAALYVSASVTHITHNYGRRCRQVCILKEMRAEKNSRLLERHVSASASQ